MKNYNSPVVVSTSIIAGTILAVSSNITFPSNNGIKIGGIGNNISGD